MANVENKCKPTKHETLGKIWKITLVASLPLWTYVTYWNTFSMVTLGYIHMDCDVIRRGMWLRTSQKIHDPDSRLSHELKKNSLQLNREKKIQISIIHVQCRCLLMMPFKGQLNRRWMNVMKRKKKWIATRYEWPLLWSSVLTIIRNSQSLNNCSDPSIRAHLFIDLSLMWELLWASSSHWCLCCWTVLLYTSENY